MKGYETDHLIIENLFVVHWSTITHEIKPLTTILRPKTN